MVPVNLIAEIQHVGFDYGMSAKEVAENVVAGHLVLWERQMGIPLHADQATTAATHAVPDGETDSLRGGAP